MSEKRIVILDTETTGFNPKVDRMVEVGALEMRGRKLTRRTFHQYMNPQYEVGAGAVKVHGLTNAFLANKPLFSEIAEDLWDFLVGAECVIHNAPFDVGFLNAEFARLRQPNGYAYPPLSEICKITDTLVMARKKHTGQANSLDALCKRYKVDNSGRDFHGALLDAELLADVYLRMTGGQLDLFAAARSNKSSADEDSDAAQTNLISSGKIIRADENELSAHQEFADKEMA